MAIRAGSWGTPELGITEFIGGLLGQQRNQQGGSNLSGRSVASPVPAANTSRLVKGAGGTQLAGSSPSPISRQVAGISTYTAPSSTNYSTSYSTPGTSTQPPNQPPFDPNAAQSDLFGQVDAAYGDVYSGLDSQESSLRAGEQDLYNQFTGQYDAQRPLLDQALQEGQTLNQQQVSGVKQEEANALSAARRLYQELTQGAQQRFGGSNSAAEFANAFLGRQFQQNTGNIKNTVGQNLSKLADQYTTIQNDYQTKLQSLEQQKQSALAQAKDVFRQRLDAINQARNVANQNKAQLKLQALQELRGQIANVQSSALQMQQTLQQTVAQTAAQLAANVQAYKAQAGAPVNVDAIKQAVYSSFSGPQQAQGGISQVYGSYNPQSQVDDYLKRVYGQ